MTTTIPATDTTVADPFPRDPGADYASVGALLVVGDQLGVVGHLDAGRSVTAGDLARSAGLPEQAVTAYLEALAAAGVVEPVPGEPETFQPVPDFALIRYYAGYLSWTMNANRPFIEHAREFIESPQQAREAYQRAGREVAISSQWIGSLGFYSVALSTIVDAKPRRVVDLGAGSARLLIEVLRRCPDATAVALDIDAAACAEARKAADAAQLGDRLEVLHRSIQSVADDPTPVIDADIVHAGFVFHDLMPDEEHIADRVLRNCFERMNPAGMMAITDAAPYVRTERERRFSAVMTYFHHQFMGRKLLTEAEWQAKLLAAGFDRVETMQHRLPSGRLYVARKGEVVG